MTSPESPKPRVAIVGAGAIGCGWASLCVTHAWPAVLVDADARTMDRALAEIARRARALVALGRADADLVEEGLCGVQPARSLLHACGAADWIIESVPEDLALKHRLFENLGQVAQHSAVISSSSSGLPITDVAARCREPGRCITAHPLNPPELIPLVEVVPGKFTAPGTVDTMRTWLRKLGRIPIVLNREVPGNVVGRIAAAVWRECIDLVLTGVVDVDEIDRAVSLGPGLGWAAAGPHLTYHLGAGEGGVGVFLQQLLQSFEGWWGSLARWEKLEPEQVRALTALIEKSYGQKLDALGEARDRRLAAILQALEQARRG
jgi:3-hydroxypropionate dehydrogenase (NADP+)